MRNKRLRNEFKQGQLAHCNVVSCIDPHWTKTLDVQKTPSVVKSDDLRHRNRARISTKGNRLSPMHESAIRRCKGKSNHFVALKGRNCD